jgi:deoxycytidylate deaminase
MLPLPFLPSNGTVELTDSHDPFMKEAELACKELSNELMQPTGAVIVKDGVVVARGANHAILPVFLRNAHKQGLCSRKAFKVKSGTKYWLCPGCAAPSRHAEQRAVDDGLAKGLDLKGSTLYLYGHWWACEPCWNKVLSAGISVIKIRSDAQDLFRPESPQNILGKRS